MTSMSTRQFLEQYELKLSKEFDLDGEAAQWAPNVSGPRFWGEEDAYIDLQLDASTETTISHVAGAFSPDEKYLAVSINNYIKIYDIDSRRLQAEVLGHRNDIMNLFFSSWTAEHAASASSADGMACNVEPVRYLLFAEGERRRERDLEEHNVVWPIDASGGFKQTSSSLPVDQLVSKAMHAMSPDLSTHQDIVEADVAALRVQLTEAVELTNLKMQQRQQQILHGLRPHFGTQPVSRDGRKCFYIVNQYGASSGRQQVVVWDLVRQVEICRLKGHTDSIMWAGWAVDDQVIVTACWDQTFKFWDAENGQCRHTVGPTGGQNWAGCLSPDGQHVVLAGMNPVHVGVHFAATGVKTANLVSERLTPHHNWIRTLCWDPSPDEVVMESENAILSMDPTTGSSRVLLEYQREESMLNSFTNFRRIQWFEKGNILVVNGSDKTIFVWDKARNVKWRFQRPQGRAVKHSEHRVHYIARQKTIVSVDGDLKVRYWKL